MTRSRVIPDEEIVTHGHVHIERMDDDYIVLNINGILFEMFAGVDRLHWVPKVRDWPLIEEYWNEEAQDGA